MSAFDEITSPEYRRVIAQGAILLEVAALQRGNLGAPRSLSSITFTADDQVEINAVYPQNYLTSTSFALLLDRAAVRQRICDLLQWQLRDGDAIGEGPLQSNAALVAELLRDLGTNPDALVMYRSDLRPLSFHCISSVPGYCDVLLRDSAGTNHGFRYDWNRDADHPLAGELYGIVDAIADMQ